MKKDLTPSTIYAAALAALPACDIDHHASDLYLKRTPAAVALVERLDNTALLSVFHDPDGVAWYELPFCFSQSGIADYFKFTGYGNIQSIFSCELSSYIDMEDIAEYCVDNGKALYNDEIQEILDSEGEETEE